MIFIKKQFIFIFLILGIFIPNINSMMSDRLEKSQHAAQQRNKGKKAGRGRGGPKIASSSRPNEQRKSLTISNVRGTQGPNIVKRNIIITQDERDNLLKNVNNQIKNLKPSSSLQAITGALNATSKLNTNRENRWKLLDLLVSAFIKSKADLQNKIEDLKNKIEVLIEFHTSLYKCLEDKETEESESFNDFKSKLLIYINRLYNIGRKVTAKGEIYAPDKEIEILESDVKELISYYVNLEYEASNQDYRNNEVRLNDYENINPQEIRTNEDKILVLKNYFRLQFLVKNSVKNSENKETKESEETVDFAKIYYVLSHFKDTLKFALAEIKEKHQEKYKTTLHLLVNFSLMIIQDDGFYNFVQNNSDMYEDLKVQLFKFLELTTGILSSTSNKQRKNAISKFGRAIIEVNNCFKSFAELYINQLKEDLEDPLDISYNSALKATNSNVTKALKVLIQCIIRLGKLTFIFNNRAFLDQDKSNSSLAVFDEISLDKIFVCLNYEANSKELRELYHDAICNLGEDPTLKANFFRVLQNYLFSKTEVLNEILKNSSKNRSLNNIAIVGESKGPLWEIAVALWLYKLLKPLNTDHIEALDEHVKMPGHNFSREFDIITSKVLIECKNHDWNLCGFNTPKANKLMKQFIDQYNIAQAIKKLFIIISGQDIPANWIIWLNNQHIKYVDRFNCLVIPEGNKNRQLNFTNLYRTYAYTKYSGLLGLNY